MERVRNCGARLQLNGTVGTPQEVLPLLKYRPHALLVDDPAALKATLDEFARHRVKIDRLLEQFDGAGPGLLLGDVAVGADRLDDLIAARAASMGCSRPCSLARSRISDMPHNLISLPSRRCRVSVTPPRDRTRDAPEGFNSGPESREPISRQLGRAGGRCR